MLSTMSVKVYEIAGVAACNAHSVYTIKSKIRQYSFTKTPSSVGGRHRSITHAMLDAPCESFVKMRWYSFT